MPVIVKTSVCPITFLPTKQKQGQWKISGSMPDWQAIFYDNNNHIQGFALSGEAVKLKQKLLQQIKTQAIES